MNGLFNLIFILAPILVLGGFIYTIAMMVSPKLRGKVMENQMKSLKYMMEESQDVLKDLNTMGANIQEQGIEIKARAAKRGLAGDRIYCKHCGSSIDADSRFCKSCGKTQ